jgi:hypothetical protein
MSSRFLLGAARIGQHQFIGSAFIRWWIGHGNSDPVGCRTLTTIVGSDFQQLLNLSALQTQKKAEMYYYVFCYLKKKGN